MTSMAAIPTGITGNPLSTAPQRGQTPTSVDIIAPQAGHDVILVIALALPHPDPRLASVRKLHAGGLQRALNCSEIISRRYSSALFKVPYRAFAEIRASAQLGLGPIQ
jgi:hypothetical protein